MIRTAALLQVDSWVSVPKIPEAVTHQSEGKKSNTDSHPKEKKREKPIAIQKIFIQKDCLSPEIGAASLSKVGPPHIF